MQYTSRREGFTLVELAVALAVLAIAISLAVPSWNQVSQKRLVTSSAVQLAAFLSVAQGNAVKSNDELTISLLHSAPEDWCVGATLGSAACDCTETDPASASYCDVNGAPQILRSSEHQLSDMAAHSADTSFTFEPIRGFMSNADLGPMHYFNLVSPGGDFGLQVKVLPTGHARLCNYDTTKRVPGYVDCPVVVVLP